MHGISLLIVVSLVCLHTATLVSGQKCTSAAETELANQHYLQKRSTISGSVFSCKSGFKPSANSAGSYQMTCDSKAQWNLYPKLRDGTSTACVERPTCKVSDLNDIKSFNNFKSIDMEATTINPGSDFVFRCKTTEFKQVGSGKLSAQCATDGTWTHAFPSTGDEKACVAETKCTKTSLLASSEHHNLNFKMLNDGGTYVHDISKVNDLLSAQAQVKLACKSGFTKSGSGTFYAVCGVDGIWTDTQKNAQSFASDASTKMCSAPKSKCTVNMIEYADQQSWSSGCNTCTCHDGSVECTKKVCPTCSKTSVKVAVNNAELYGSRGSALSDGNFLFFLLFFVYLFFFLFFLFFSSLLLSIFSTPLRPREILSSPLTSYCCISHLFLLFFF